MLYLLKFSLPGHVGAIGGLGGRRAGGQVCSRELSTIEIYTKTAATRLLDRIGAGIKVRRGLTAALVLIYQQTAAVTLPVCPPRPRTPIVPPSDKLSNCASGYVPVIKRSGPWQSTNHKNRVLHRIFLIFPLLRYVTRFSAPFYYQKPVKNAFLDTEHRYLWYPAALLVEMLKRSAVVPDTRPRVESYLF